MDDSKLHNSKDSVKLLISLCDCSFELLLWFPNIVMCLRFWSVWIYIWFCPGLLCPFLLHFTITVYDDIT